MAGKTWQHSHEPPPPDKTGTDTQWKAKGGEGREQKTNATHIMLQLINKRYSPEHKELQACTSILSLPNDQLTADTPSRLLG